MITPEVKEPEVNLTAEVVDTKAMMLADLESLREDGYGRIDEAIEEVHSPKAVSDE